MLILTLSYVVIGLCSLLLVKNQVTYHIRIKAINQNFEAYMCGPGYNEMLFNPFGWTYSYFYGRP